MTYTNCVFIFKMNGCKLYSVSAIYCLSFMFEIYFLLLWYLFRLALNTHTFISPFLPLSSAYRPHDPNHKWVCAQQTLSSRWERTQIRRTTAMTSTTTTMLQVHKRDSSVSNQAQKLWYQSSPRRLWVRWANAPFPWHWKRHYFWKCN